MYEFYPYFTNDGSVGLYSKEENDIYHSAYGALTEAYEKFILPANLDEYFSSNNEIRILDICYGIGYNTKSFLNYYLENIYKSKIQIQNKSFFKLKIPKIIFFEKLFQNFSKKFANKISRSSHYNGAIHTDNILERKTKENYNKHKKYNATIYTDKIIEKKERKILLKNNTYTEAIYADNNFTNNLHDLRKKNKIFITAIDTDKILMYLSPFFKINGKNRKLPFNNEKVERMLKVKVKKEYSLKKETNVILFELLKNNCPDFFENETLNFILTQSKYQPFFDNYMLYLYKYCKNNIYNKGYLTCLSSFLHNIYYRYISKRYKKALKALRINDIKLDIKTDDARKILISNNNLYNYIFLDAFSPNKCPCLWTLEFFQKLYEHLDENGMIFTYSNSANIRNTFLQTGFFVGKNYNHNLKKFAGTIATNNKSLIKYELSEFDLGLMKTKAGIIYRDKNLNSLNEEIIKRHEYEFENSNLISSTKFFKENNCKEILKNEIINLADNNVKI